MAERTVFFVSDQTGVTVETLGHSLLTQFDKVEFNLVTVPFVDSLGKAEQVTERINRTAIQSGLRPIVFTSFVQDEVRAPLLRCNGLVLDFFEAFLSKIEEELDSQSSHVSGKAHGMQDATSYNSRIEAMNFAMDADDGRTTQQYDKADVIMTGVSRSGKTPTCVYMALQYGIFAANYPLTEDNLEIDQLPDTLVPFQKKLYGLTIEPERLRQIRLGRWSVGRYASAEQVNLELRAAEMLFKRHNIPYIDTTHCSIEEIASTILNEMGVERHLLL